MLVIKRWRSTGGLALACTTALRRIVDWRKLLDSGVYATIDEMAAAEKINASYVSRVLRLTLLAPDIVEAILDGRQPGEMTLAVLMRPVSVGWSGQKVAFGLTMREQSHGIARRVVPQI